MTQSLVFHPHSFGMYVCRCGQVVSWSGETQPEHVCGTAQSMVWLSFAGDEGYIGAIFVDAESFEDAYMAVSMSLLNPGGEVQGIVIPLDEIPEDKREAYAALPRMTLLTKADLLAHGLGPLVNMDGDPV